MIRHLGAALAAAIVLASCSAAQQAKFDATVAKVEAKVSGFIGQVKTFDEKATTDIAAFNAQAGVTLQQVGNSVCGAISMGNGLFSVVAPIAGVDSKGQAAEAQVVATANDACPRIAAGAPTLTADVKTALGAYQDYKANIKAAAPSVAAAASASQRTSS